LEEGIYRINKREWDKAGWLFEKAAALEPLAPAPHFGLAVSYLRQMDYVSANKELDSARRLKKGQRVLEKDGQFRALIQTAYGNSLFGISEVMLDQIELEIIKAGRQKTLNSPQVSP